MIHSTLQNTAATLLAAALFDCLPGSLLWDVGETHGGFYCEFSFPKPLATDLPVMLEERLRQIIRENRPIRLMQMIPFSAAEMLKKEGQPERAAAVLEQEDFVQIAQIGPFADFRPGPHLATTGPVGVMKVVELKPVTKGRYRLFGLAGANKQQLKALFDAWKAFPSRDHLRAPFWIQLDGRLIWLPQGLAARCRQKTFWKERLPAEQIEGGEGLYKQIVETRKKAVMEWTRLPGGAGERGALDAAESGVFRGHFFENSAKDCISFLQAIQQCLTILGFTYRIRTSGRRRKGGPLAAALKELGDRALKEQDASALGEQGDKALKESAWKADVESGEVPQVEFLIEDCLHAEWVAASVGERGFVVWVERNLALLLEREDGFLKMNEKSDCE